MRIALLPSTQWGNPVLGGGSEAEYMQDVAKRLKPLLEASGHTCMIFAGKSDANTDGAYEAVGWKAQLALSIHSDAGGGIALGSLICYQEDRSLPFCRSILNNFCKLMGTANRGYMKRTPGINGVAVLRIPETICPTCLVETVRHDMAATAQLVRDPGWRQRAAEALRVGVVAYAGGTIEEDDMWSNRADGLEPRKKFGAHFYAGPLDGYNETAYLAITNLSGKEAKVRVVVPGSAVEAKEYPVPYAATPLEVDLVKTFKLKGPCFIEAVSDNPCYFTIDRRGVKA